MGDIAEYYRGRDFESEEYLEIINLIHKGVWTTKNGEEIRIKDMVPLHLRNCLRRFNSSTDLGKALRCYLGKNNIKIN